MKSEIEILDPTTTEILDRLMEEPAPFMEVLHAIQDHHGYLPEESLKQVAQRFQIPISEL